MLIRIDILDDMFYRVPFYRNALFLGINFGFMDRGSHEDLQTNITIYFKLN